MNKLSQRVIIDLVTDPEIENHIILKEKKNVYDLHTICYRKNANDNKSLYLKFAFAIPVVAIIQTLPVNIATDIFASTTLSIKGKGQDD